MDDQLAMVLSDHGSTARMLSMVELLAKFETNAIVWKSVISILSLIRSLTWSSDELADSYDRFFLDVVRPVLARVGHLPVHKESTNDAMLRSIVFTLMATLGDETTLQVRFGTFWLPNTFNTKFRFLLSGLSRAVPKPA